MSEYIEPLQLLIEQLRKLPGVRAKSALKMAFGILDMPENDAEMLTDSIINAKKKIHKCPVCANIAVGELCPICSDDKRDHSLICVVEDIKSLMSMERVSSFRGVYHVLGGTISPIDGRGPDDINISSLISRVNNEEVKEVIVATNATVDGETTALYISKLLKPLGVVTTRIAYGMPVGGDIDYADEMTLLRAIEGRREIT